LSLVVRKGRDEAIKYRQTSRLLDVIAIVCRSSESVEMLYNLLELGDHIALQRLRLRRCRRLNLGDSLIFCVMKA